MIKLLEGSVAGTFHAVSPPPPFGFGDLLTAIAAEVAPPGTALTWVGKQYLLDAGEDDVTLPMWPGGDSESAANAASPAAALAAGLAPRPLGQSVAEIHEHELRHPADARNPGGLSPERESRAAVRLGRGQPVAQPASQSPEPGAAGYRRQSGPTTGAGPEGARRTGTGPEVAIMSGISGMCNSTRYKFWSVARSDRRAGLTGPGS